MKSNVPSYRKKREINEYLKRLSGQSYGRQEDFQKERPYQRDDYRDSRKEPWYNFRDSERRREQESERRYYPSQIRC